MEAWLKWVRELQALAQTGLHYTKDIYDIERFERINQIAKEMMAYLMNTTITAVEDLYSDEKGHQTPKIDTRAAVWNEKNQLLLVQELDGLWALPGGWMDVTETIASNVQKEVFEEAGAKVAVGKLIALQDRNIHNPGKNPFTIVKVFVECDYLQGAFCENSETIAMEFFDVDKLPPLMERKTSHEQIQLCYQARMAGEKWRVLFD